ncbi:MAG: septum formation inhibitor Maf [Frankiales bacterium]|nr:septum formation inhibitor Maf [Frankiales bacterium]
MTGSTRTVVLASASPARRALLRAAGIEPVVRVSGVDEDALEAAMAAAGRTDPAEVAAALAAAKAAAVAEAVRAELPGAVVVACDSVLDLDGVALGKPHDAEEAVRRWHAMRGRSGRLRTGHTVLVLGAAPAQDRTASGVASTAVEFADLDDATVEAYVATGEPLAVAGAFTLDGLGGPFVERIDGDPSNVVGLSLPLLRRLLAGLGVPWTDLWHGGTRGPQ